MPDTNSEQQNSKTVRAYGTWPSSLGATEVAAQSRRLAEPQLSNGRTYWLEARPQEKGRVQIIARGSDGARQALLPEGFSARSRVHEYGGGSYLATPEALVFVNDRDQRVYRLSFDSRDLLPLSPEGNDRFADLHLDQRNQRLLAVREASDSAGGEPVNSVVALPLDGSQRSTTLATGADFYSNPRLSPDGTKLCWLEWNHPAMPWDGTRLYVGHLSDLGVPEGSMCIAGGDNESIFQPQWGPDGGLYFVSDRSNWWNIYRVDPACAAPPEAITAIDAEFATPQWAFGMSTYGFVGERELLAAYSQNGRWHLSHIALGSRKLVEVEIPLTQISGLDCDGNCAVFLGASPAKPAGVYLYQAQTLEPLTDSPAPLAAEDVSPPQSICFPTGEGAEAHAFFYGPLNSRFRGPDGEKPPLIVICHGGPTGATETSLNLKIQYWTNRGFAVLDVNYRGSTGYGREYRRQLYGNWGVRDLDDVCAAADYVTRQGWVHPHQRVIKGSSAGGYTVLAALTFRDTFDAGVSLYGVADLELLARDTHKFESRYLDSLVGPYPAEQERYRALSPIHHVERLDRPLLVFQGLEDKVVPPNQAEAIVNAVSARKIPVAYVTYAEEGHGFRQGDNIRHMFAAEQYFYQRIFHLGEPQGEAIIDIKNLDSGS